MGRVFTGKVYFASTTNENRRPALLPIGTSVFAVQVRSEDVNYIETCLHHHPSLVAHPRRLRRTRKPPRNDHQVTWISTDPYLLLLYPNRITTKYPHCGGNRWSRQLLIPMEATIARSAIHFQVSLEAGVKRRSLSHI